MIEIDNDSFNITLKVKSDDKSKFIKQVTAVLNELYHVDEKIFTRALCISDFGQMVMCK